MIKMKQLMKTKTILFLLLSVFVWTSCGQSTSNTQVAEEQTPTEVNETLNSILTSYFEVKDALVGDDAEKAQAAATAMLDVTGPYGDKLDGYIKIIAETADIEFQRQTFEMLSINIYALAKTENAGLTLYKQFCPMAFDDKGAFWLSDNKQIMNPYFGASMLRCGKVEETIN